MSGKDPRCRQFLRDPANFGSLERWGPECTVGCCHQPAAAFPDPRAALPASGLRQGPKSRDLSLSTPGPSLARATGSVGHARLRAPVPQETGSDGDPTRKILEPEERPELMRGAPETP